MRLVSNDGIVDIPYEQYSLYLVDPGIKSKWETRIEAYPVNVKCVDPVYLGNYSKDQAKEVMKNLHRAAELHEAVFVFPSDGTID